MTDQAPVKIPSELFNNFTLNGSIPVLNWYFNEIEHKQIIWDKLLIDEHLSRFTRKNILSGSFGKEPYSGACKMHCNALDKFPIKGKNIAVIGSIKPWIEAILIDYGVSKITTVEYNVPICNHPIIETISYADFQKDFQTKYDAIFSFSSIEHSGLGRYGDQLDPNGDVKVINECYDRLKNDGLLYIGFPVGKDALIWNAHRIYGENRLRLIFEKFDKIGWFGPDLKELQKKSIGKFKQPLIVLRRRNF